MNQATAFYDALAPMFDVMTDWDARLAIEGPFLRRTLDEAGAAHVLDVACGSGGHALWLARQGYRVVGVDVSPAMIELARAKATDAGLEIPFHIGGFADLAGLGHFDAVLCLGNSLPHLLTPAELRTALRSMAAVLRPCGLLVLQNLNYDLRWQKQPRWFAAQGGELAGRQVLVWRFADYDVAAERIAFNIALFRQTEAGWTVEVHTTPQRPLFQADLAAAVIAAGCEPIGTFGGMTWPPPPFDVAQSGDLVIVARKAGS